MKIFAAHNPDSQIRHLSSSGGVFSCLAEDIIKRGGVVYGAAYGKDWTVEHHRVDTIEGLATLRGSKYVFSRVGNAYIDAVADLDVGLPVLFSGTPCQVAAMRKRAGTKPLLLLVEIVCHGAPKPEYWSRYLSELCREQGRSVDDITSIDFRDKCTGWKNYSFTVQFKDGKVFTQLHDDNLYMRAFLQDYTLRKACFSCPFKQPQGSRADITLGDLWGITQLAPQIDNNHGTTLVITSCQLPGVKIDAEFSLEEVSLYNPAITTPATIPLEWEAFQKIADKRRLISTFRKYAGRPILESLYLKLARLKHRILQA